MAGGRQLGAYRILQQIGEGGMGSVWLAEHGKLGRRAAIKVLHAEYSARPDIVTRFFNEARAATAISDPGIVQIFDFGEDADGSAYIVMELLDGETLDRRLSRLGRLPPAEALRILRQVASSLGAAHARGIVHRDLKPENIFMVKDPEVAGGERPKILDFGIAKLTGDERLKTQTSALMGTPTFMSPEQCRGAGKVDQRSDVYSLGCVLFTLITGRPVFVAEGIGDVIAMHLREAPPAPSSLVPDLGPEIDRLVAACLAKDPTDRYASGAELAVAIGALIGSSPQVTDPGRLAAGTASSLVRSAPAPTTLSSAASLVTAPDSAPRSRAKVWLVAGVAAAAIAGAIAVGLTRGDRDAAPAVAAAPADAAVDPEAAVRARMKAALATFVTWSRDHAGAPCPSLASLGVSDSELRLTCTEQPADQIAGVIAADGTTSWQLGGELAELVRGPRWVAATPPAVDPPPAPTPVKQPPPRRPAKPGTTAPPPASIELDENGIPVSR